MKSARSVRNPVQTENLSTPGLEVDPSGSYKPRLEPLTKLKEATMPNKDRKDPVTEFILDRVPADLLTAYRTLSNFTYPIPDLRTFAELVDARQDQEDLFATFLLREIFREDVFPLGSPQNAFEKFHWTKPLRGRTSLRGPA